MKRSAVCLAMILLPISGVTIAGASISNVANWTPPMYSNSVSPQGWNELSDTDQYRIWTTFVPVKTPQLGIVVSLKTAEKGVDGSVTNISIVSVNAVCAANGMPPNYVQLGMSESFDEHGPIAGDAGGPTVRLVPDTNLAVAVQRACKTDARSVSTPAATLAGECSIPAPAYPVQAIRMGVQGAVSVSFNVGPGGKPTSLAVESKLGSPVLNDAALAAVSNGTCNVPQGTHLVKVVTFSLHH